MIQAFPTRDCCTWPNAGSRYSVGTLGKRACAFRKRDIFEVSDGPYPSCPQVVKKLPVWYVITEHLNLFLARALIARTNEGPTCLMQSLPRFSSGADGCLQTFLLIGQLGTVLILR